MSGLLLLLVFACRGPVGEPRQALVGDRVVAVTLADGEPARPRASLLVDGRTWSDEPVDLAWAWVADEDALWSLDPAASDATGPVPTLPDPPEGAGRIGLVATFPSGHEARALLAVTGSPAAPQVRRVTHARVPGQPLEDAEDDDLALEVRAARPTEPAEVVAPSSWTRLQARVQGAPDGTRIRWMATAGTFLELDATTADWASADLVLDDLETESSEPLPPGPVTFVALANDRQGHGAVHAFDLFVGEEPAGARIGGRWLPADASPMAPTWAYARLEADDEAPLGLRLVDVQQVSDPAATAPEVPCEGVSGPFDPLWLLQGACPREALDGVRVLARISP
ncbi:MAG: hypothetical protein H6732_04170 [Alphaproteobacteria bacterium]|nr:hypothetical protein [Alphaproteobacteria bacterium]